MTSSSESVEHIQPLRCLSGLCGMLAMKRSNYCEYHQRTMVERATSEKVGEIADSILGFILFLCAIGGVAGAIFLTTGLIVWSAQFWGARIQ